jgi:hypothetical protein
MPSPGHDALQCGADRKQASRASASLPDLIPDAGTTTPILNVRTARLDRKRHAQRARQMHGSRTIGPEEFGVDHVEAEPLAQVAKHRQQRIGHGPRRLPLPQSRQDAEAGPMNRQSFPHFPLRQLGPRPVMRVQAKRPGRQANRRDDLHGHVRQGGKAKRLPLHEDAEGRLGRTREQGGQGQHAQHRRGA